MQSEYDQEFKDLATDERLGFFRGLAAALTLVLFSLSVLYGAYNVNRAIQEAIFLIEVNSGQ